MQNQKTETPIKTVAKIDGSEIQIVSQPDNTVTITMGIEHFIDLEEILRSLAESAEFELSAMQNTLNYVMKKHIAASQHYIDKNLNALTFFNELIANLSKVQQALLKLQPVFNKHLNEQ